jgi:hypothetical protein
LSCQCIAPVGFIDGNDDAVVGYVAKLAER